MQTVFNEDQIELIVDVCTKNLLSIKTRENDFITAKPIANNTYCFISITGIVEELNELDIHLSFDCVNGLFRFEL